MMWRVCIYACLFNVSGLALAEIGPADSEYPEGFIEEEIYQNTRVFRTACYFKRGGKLYKRIGLTPSKSWYSFHGTEFRTPLTRQDKVRTQTSIDEIIQSCMDSRSYFKEKGDLKAIFAMRTAIGYLLPIIIDGEQQYPQY